jgi:hypothetical protein
VNAHRGVERQGRVTSRARAALCRAARRRGGVACRSRRTVGSRGAGPKEEERRREKRKEKKRKEKRKGKGKIRKRRKEKKKGKSLEN